MSNEKAKEWIKSAREIQNFIAGTTSDNAQIGFITGVISRESESYADQETASLKERVRELEDLLTHATSNFEFGSEEDERWYFEREKLLTNNQQSDEQ